jgi:hypothetical protein
VIGNSVTVPVIQAIAREMLKALQTPKRMTSEHSQLGLFGAINE